MISQPRYLPSITYLHRIAYVDTLVAYDDVQRVARDIENRNKLVTPNGKHQMITISICSGKRELIKNSMLCSHDDYDRHAETVKHFYKNNLVFYDQDIVDGYYNALKSSMHMRDSFVAGLQYLIDLFEMDTKVVLSSSLEYEKVGGAEQIVKICNAVNADKYISGRGGVNYGVTKEFCESHGITLYEYYNHVHPEVGFFYQIFNDGFDKWYNVFKESRIEVYNKLDKVNI
jgi:hypothetical protein